MGGCMKFSTVDVITSASMDGDVGPGSSGKGPHIADKRAQAGASS